jgi:hypothetical protein
MIYTEAVFTINDQDQVISINSEYGMIIKDKNNDKQINIYFDKKEMERFIKFLKLYPKL